MKCLSVALLAGAAVALSAAPSIARTSQGQAAVASSPSPEAQRLSHELIEAVGGEANMKATMQAAFDQVMKGMPEETTPDAKTKMDALKAYVKDWMDRRTGLFVEAAAQAYAQTFTEQELRDLLAFYRTPSGQSVAVKMPTVIRASGVAITPLVRALQRDIVLKACDLNSCTPQQIAQLNAAFADAPPTP